MLYTIVTKLNRRLSKSSSSLVFFRHYVSHTLPPLASLHHLPLSVSSSHNLTCAPIPPCFPYRPEEDIPGTSFVLDFNLSYGKRSARVSEQKKRNFQVKISSRFSDLFVLWVLRRFWREAFQEDAESLRSDVRIVSSLPSTHLMSRLTIENQIPWDFSPF